VGMVTGCGLRTADSIPEKLLPPVGAYQERAGRTAGRASGLATSRARPGRRPIVDLRRSPAERRIDHRFEVSVATVSSRSATHRRPCDRGGGALPAALREALPCSRGYDDAGAAVLGRGVRRSQPDDGPEAGVHVLQWEAVANPRLPLLACELPRPGCAPPVWLDESEKARSDRWLRTGSGSSTT
jgi:hypothetical protein